jgi:hypothetical protein
VVLEVDLTTRVYWRMWILQRCWAGKVFDHVLRSESMQSKHGRTGKIHRCHERIERIEGEGWTSESVTEQEERHEVDGKSRYEIKHAFRTISTG